MSAGNPTYLALLSAVMEAAKREESFKDEPRWGRA